MPRSILIADDSVTIRRVVELAFSDTDVRVESAGTGTEAIAKLAALRPDVVLADVVMPEPSGYEICRAVKSSDRPVPVLLLAGTFEPFDPERAHACGADGHLVKPFDSRTLVSQVMRFLDAAPVRPVLLPDLAAEAFARPSADDDVEAVFDDLAGLPPGDRPRRPDPAPAVDVALAEPVPAGPPARVPSISEETSAAAAARPLDEAAIDAIALRVVERLTDRVLRDIAWDVVPDLAEAIIRERIRQLERDDEGQ